MRLALQSERGIYSASTREVPMMQDFSNGGEHGVPPSGGGARANTTTMKHSTLSKRRTTHRLKPGLRTMPALARTSRPARSLSAKPN
jgi:hypothetical protein